MSGRLFYYMQEERLYMCDEVFFMREEYRQIRTFHI
jgi:hypothetical protein